MRLVTLFISSFLFFCSVLSPPTPASESKKHPLVKELDACLNAQPGTTTERYCVNRMIPKWEARMQDYYQRLGGDQIKA